MIQIRHVQPEDRDAKVCLTMSEKLGLTANNIKTIKKSEIAFCNFTLLLSFNPKRVLELPTTRPIFPNI